MRFFSLIAFVFVQSVCFGQDPHSSHPYSGNTNLNPSFVGRDSLHTIAINHRRQWPNVQRKYITTRINYNHFLRKANAHLGVEILNDDAGSGTLQHSSISINYAQNINWGKVQIRPSLKLGYFQKVLDWNKLTFGDQIDQELGFIYQSSDPLSVGGIQIVSNFSISIGTLMQFKNFTFGCSAHQINQPNESFVGAPEGYKAVRWNAEASYLIPLNYRFSLTPYAYYNRQKDFQELNMGVLASYRGVMLGSAYRNMDAIIVMTGFDYQRFSILYSYDITISRLAANSAGAHEFGLIFRPWYKKALSKGASGNLSSAFML